MILRITNYFVLSFVFLAFMLSGTSFSERLLAETEKVSIVTDSAGTYTFMEAGLPVLSYHFSEVPLPPGTEPHRFSKGDVDYSGAYFSDGSTFGGERSNYIQPLYGFNGEPLTLDYPVDHLHHRGVWWSWCEVRWNDRIGDLWAVNKVRAWPVKIRELTDANGTTLTAVNHWRFDDDPTDILRETTTIRISNTTLNEGKKSRYVDVDITLEALVDGVSIAGRQNVGYGGYGGMTVRMVEEAKDFSIRVVHPQPDRWDGAETSMAERVTDEKSNGFASWLAMFGRYPKHHADTVHDNTDFTTVTMFESPLGREKPSQFRYFESRCISVAFPGFDVVALPKGKLVPVNTRFWIQEGKTTIDREREQWEKYQAQEKRRATQNDNNNANYWAYIGSYTWEANEEMKHGGISASEGISVASYCPKTQTFGELRLVAKAPSPTYLTVSADNRILYGVTEGTADDSTATVCAWSINRETGDLTLLSKQNAGGDHPCHLNLSPQGQWLGIANYTGGDFVIYPILPDGSIGEETDRIRVEGKGTNAIRQEAHHAHGIYFSNDRVYLVDLGSDKVYLRTIDAQGKLQPSPIAEELSLPAGAGPRHLALISEGEVDYLFVCNELDSTLSLFQVGPDGVSSHGCYSTLPPEYLGKVTDNPDQVGKGEFTLYNTTAEVVAYREKNIYVSNRGDDSFAVFTFRPQGENSLLKWQENYPTGGKTPRFIGLVPETNQFVACNQDSSNVVVCHIDPESGALTASDAKPLTVAYPVVMVFVPK